MMRISFILKFGSMQGHSVVVYGLRLNPRKRYVVAVFILDQMMIMFFDSESGSSVDF